VRHEADAPDVLVAVFLAEAQPLLRYWRTTSPSSTTGLRSRVSSSRATAAAKVDFPDPDKPVNQTVKPRRFM